LNDSINNELLFINLANGYEQTEILISGLDKCVAVLGNSLFSGPKITSEANVCEIKRILKINNLKKL